MHIKFDHIFGVKKLAIFILIVEIYAMKIVIGNSMQLAYRLESRRWTHANINMCN